MNNIKNNQSGFSLVEVLVSLVIISILITGFSTAFINSNRSLRISKNKSEAFYGAQEDLINFLGNDSYTASNANVSLDESNNVINKTITFQDEDIEVKIKEVEANVTYEGFNNQNKDITIKTYRVID